MIIQTDEKSVTLTPFGSLALNGVANMSRDGGQSWIEIIRRALSQADQKPFGTAASPSAFTPACRSPALNPMR
jgi:hypothetical protein